MTREEYLKILILESNHTIKSFAKEINVPYTTLYTILSNGVGGAAVDTVIKICSNLSITVEKLCGAEIQDDPFRTSEHERDLIIAYRSRPDLQNAVDILLGIEKKKAESRIS